MHDDDRPSRATLVRVASVGDNCIDVYGPGVSAVGGNALNVAVGLIRPGVRASYVGEVGSDDAGRRVLTAASTIGIDVERVHVVEGSTWVAHITVGDDGVARLAWEEPGACGPYVVREDELDFLTALDHVHMANLADRSVVIAALRRAGVSTSYDYGHSWPAEDEALPRIVFGSVDGPGAAEAGRDLARSTHERGADLVVAMLGAAGSLAADGRELVTQPARPIQPVDTLGAGDRYIAEFLANFLDHVPLSHSMVRAGDVASEACMHWASWPQRPPGPSSIGAVGR